MIIDKSTKQNLLPVMETFHSIQGEGYYQGESAFFIRLGGCNVGCAWCDVKNSWDMKNSQNLSINKIIFNIEKAPTKIVIITGGEPLMNDLSLLTHELNNIGKRNHLETSAAYPLSGQWDWICVSPKKSRPPLRSVLIKANELKIIIYNQSDFKWAEKNVSDVNAECKLYLQPEWSQTNKMIPFILEYIYKNPQWILSLQIHKYLHLP